MKVRRPFWIAGIATVALIICALMFVDTVPPGSQTYVAMHMAKRRVLRFAVKHNSLPVLLSETEEIPGFDNSAKDGWGHELIYTVAANGDVTLTSLGKDNKPGGSNDNSDIVGVFAAKSSSGSWSEEFVAWKIDPSVGLRNKCSRTSRYSATPMIESVLLISARQYGVAEL